MFILKTFFQFSPEKKKYQREVKLTRNSHSENTAPSESKYKGRIQAELLITQSESKYKGRIQAELLITS